MKKSLILLLMLVGMPIAAFCIDCYSQFSQDWHTVTDNFESAVNDVMCQELAGCIHHAHINRDMSYNMIIRDFNACIEGN